MNTRKLLSKINYALNHIQYGEEEEEKDIKTSFKRLKDEIKLINYYKREIKKLIEKKENLLNINKEQIIVLNIIKEYFTICNDKTSFDTFLTSNYPFKHVRLVKKFLGSNLYIRNNRFELIIPKDRFNDEILNKVKGFDKYAYILHDKDDIDPHYHIYIYSFHYLNIEFLASYLCISSKYINVIHGPAKLILKYFVHDGLSDKHQYDKSEIIKNF